MHLIIDSCFALEIMAHSNTPMLYVHTETEIKINKGNKEQERRMASAEVTIDY